MLVPLSALPYMAGESGWTSKEAVESGEKGEFGEVESENVFDEGEDEESEEESKRMKEGFERENWREFFFFFNRERSGGCNGEEEG